MRNIAEERVTIDSYLVDSLIEPDKHKRIECGVTDD